MKVFNNPQEAGTTLEKTVLAIGNFDGVHLGHQQLIRNMVNRARELKACAVVMTFFPHPIQVLAPDRAPRLLNRPETKIERLSSLGVDAVVVMPFTRDLAQMSPESFVRRIIHEQLNAQAVYVGFNYTFGHRGAGTAKTLQGFGRELGFEVEVLPPRMMKNTVISSTEVRRSLLEGDITQARRLLGYWPILEGRLVSGDKRPESVTAELLIDRQTLVPAWGVYAAKLKAGNRMLECTAYIGYNSVFGDENPSVEVYIPELHQSFPELPATLYLLRKLRSEKKGQVYHS